MSRGRHLGNFHLIQPHAPGLSSEYSFTIKECSPKECALKTPIVLIITFVDFICLKINKTSLTDSAGFSIIIRTSRILLLISVRHENNH